MLKCFYMDFEATQLNKSETATEEAVVAVDLEQITLALLAVLDARSKDIVTRRFGLNSEKSETLESIGREYGITRERVRQIEANAKKALASLDAVSAPAYKLLSGVFSAHGGVLSENHAVELASQHVGHEVSPNMIHFQLEILPAFAHVSNEQLFGSHWRHEPSLHSHIDGVVVAATDILKKENRPLALQELIDSVQARVGDALPANTIHATLVASKNISPTAFGDWGLIGWAETSPRGVGDKAFAVLRRHGKPAHFRDITEFINGAEFDHKKANPQTVHNELIKDGRFVLVGRGLYGLKEWGFMTGTVADVLESILDKADEALTKEELIDRVLKQRMVKKNTILLSLQNSDRFERTSDGRYKLKESQLQPASA